MTQVNHHATGHWSDSDGNHVDYTSIESEVLVFEREVKLYFHDSARIGRVTGATAVRFSGTQPPLD